MMKGTEAALKACRKRSRTRAEIREEISVENRGQSPIFEMQLIGSAVDDVTRSDRFA